MSDLKKSLLETFPDLEIKEQEPMSKHTTFRVGGPAELYITPKANQIADIVKRCQQFEMPFLIIGNGSNLLVGDLGIKGVVIEIGKNAGEIEIEQTTVKANAGAMLSVIAKEAAEHSLTGLEFASGIPGCLGGAIVMNAGAYGGEMKQVVKKVTLLTKQGELLEKTGDEMEFSYRNSIVSKKEYIVLSVEMELQKGNKDEIIACMKDLNNRRREKQPLEYPSAGSTFKRPEGYFAGKLIQDSGLSGYQVGGAKVSEKHCGFVINAGGATAADIKKLMEDVGAIVKEKYGVTLEPEVKMVGQF
ncbi:MAG: UDP-N-acetylmuramate dehydrogenase [Lachnospiraceae bacterium]|nr:UDP-N-acetylmuramate dehydrogenase [Lachnospiraceae bacterium]